MLINQWNYYSYDDRLDLKFLCKKIKMKFITHFKDEEEKNWAFYDPIRVLFVIKKNFLETKNLFL